MVFAAIRYDNIFVLRSAESILAFGSDVVDPHLKNIYVLYVFMFQYVFFRI